jgi:hypothetical protein
MEKKDSDLINAHLTKFAENIGVPTNILNRPNGFAKWEGRFDAMIDGNMMPMVLRPMAIEVQSNPPIALFCSGDGSINSELGEIFHASYSSSTLDGGVQIFRFKDSDKRGNMGEYMFAQTASNGQKNKVKVEISFNAT